VFLFVRSKRKKAKKKEEKKRRKKEKIALLLLNEAFLSTFLFFCTNKVLNLSFFVIHSIHSNFSSPIQILFIISCSIVYLEIRIKSNNNLRGFARFFSSSFFNDLASQVDSQFQIKNGKLLGQSTH
jgi:hypothetical protein